jgi:hypothetical protein
LLTSLPLSLLGQNDKPSASKASSKKTPLGAKKVSRRPERRTFNSPLLSRRALSRPRLSTQQAAAKKPVAAKKPELKKVTKRKAPSERKVSYSLITAASAEAYIPPRLSHSPLSSPPPVSSPHRRYFFTYLFSFGARIDRLLLQAAAAEAKKQAATKKAAAQKVTKKATAAKKAPAKKPAAAKTVKKETKPAAKVRIETLSLQLLGARRVVR